MKALPAKKNIWWVGALDYDIRVFDIIMWTDYGTTYNSYIVKGKEKTVLFETVKEKFFDEHLERIREVCDPSEIDYIVVSHTEPDHTGSLARMLALAPKAVVLASSSAISFLKEILNAPFPSRVVTEKDVINLGGMSMRFFSAPLLHWPDTIYTYIAELKALFTCDSFGCHYASDKVFNDAIEGDFYDAYKYYFDHIMGPFKNPHVLNALAKIEKLDIDFIGNGHGPVLRQDVWKYIDMYRKWATPEPEKELSIVICYVSAYGYTKQLGEKIVEGIRAQGISNIKLFDLVYDDKAAAKEELQSCTGFLLGSPTLVGDALPPVYEMLLGLNPIIHKGKFAGAFGSYGWSGEAVPNLMARLAQLKFTTPPEGLRIKLKPSDIQLDTAFQYGSAFAKMMLEVTGSVPIPEKKAKKWRCLICGHVSEGGSPPEACPVCGANKDQFKEAAEEKVVAAVDKGETLVVGGSIAAKEAARSAPIPVKKTKKWRCLICGQVFEGGSPPETCPVCGAGKDQFEEAAEEKVGAVADTEENFVIIGGGIAAKEASASIRLRNKTAKIIMLCAENYTPYNRPGLSDFIAGTLREASLPIETDGWYAENRVELLLGEKAVKLNSIDKSVTTASGKTIIYDKLLIATGGFPFIPIEEAKDKANVFVLRTLDDAKKILAKLSSAEKAVVVGGGILGLEAADALVQRGVSVTIVEFSPHVMMAQLDDTAAELLQQKLSAKGVTVLTGSKVASVTDAGVLLDGGEAIDADIVLFSAGVRSELTLAKDAGVEVDRGIKTNSLLQTNVKDIYAAGDCAQQGPAPVSIWPAAAAQGKIAGANMAGDTAMLETQVFSTLFDAFGVLIFTAGSIREDGTTAALVFKDSAKSIYKKLIYNNGKLLGGLFYGDTTSNTKLLRAVESRADISFASELLG